MSDKVYVTGPLPDWVREECRKPDGVLMVADDDSAVEIVHRLSATDEQRLRAIIRDELARCGLITKTLSVPITKSDPLD